MLRSRIESAVQINWQRSDDKRNAADVHHNVVLAQAGLRNTTEQASKQTNKVLAINAIVTR